MRLAPLLAQYLYLHKRLDLTGLGSFFLNDHDIGDADSSRHGKTIHTENIRFETNITVRESPELIAFISAQTGKIKALASADLESHLELAQQFLNIGKPFYLEGIGTIVRIKAGEFTFTPGTAIAELKKEITPKEQVVTTEENPADYNYKSIFYPKPVKSNWKKPVAVLLLVAGLIVAIWGGYTVYKRTNSKKDKEQQANEQVNEVTLTDTASKTIQITPPNPPGTFKFILENADSGRAFTRFNRLKSFQWDVKIESSDSMNYKIFMVLPASVTDTTRILDSLRALTGRKVYVE